MTMSQISSGWWEKRDLALSKVLEKAKLDLEARTLGRMGSGSFRHLVIECDLFGGCRLGVVIYIESLQFHQTWHAGKWTTEMSDFPEKPPFIEDFPLPCLITRVYHIRSGKGIPGGLLPFPFTEWLGRSWNSELWIFRTSQVWHRRISVIQLYWIWIHRHA